MILNMFNNTFYNLVLVADRRCRSTESETSSESAMSTVGPARHHPSRPVQQRSGEQHHHLKIYDWIDEENSYFP